MDLTLRDGVIPRSRHHFRAPGYESRLDWAEVVLETAVTLYVNGEEYVTAALTPIDLEDWATGFLAGEGLITSASDITIFQWRPDDGQIWVRVPGLHLHPPEGSRYLGSCCGQSRPGFLRPTGGQPVQSSLTVPRNQIPGWFMELSAWSQAQHSGGLHAAGLVTGTTFHSARADVGRHNALDKLYGSFLKTAPAPAADCVLVFTGRLSGEIIWKVANMGCPVIISNAAPTTLGIDLAAQLGITAIGFARDGEFSVYSHPERVRP